MVGASDTDDFRQIAEVLSSQLPNVRQVVMSGCWHLPPMEEPDTFNERLVRLLRSTSGRA